MLLSIVLILLGFTGLILVGIHASDSVNVAWAVILLVCNYFLTQKSAVKPGPDVP